MSELTPGHAAGRRALVNTSFRAIGELSGKLATFVLFAMLARELGQASVGAFVLAFAYVQIVTVFIDLGFDRVVTRRVAVDAASMPRLFTNIVGLKLALAIPVTLASWALASLLGYDDQTRTAIYLLTAGLFIDSLIRTVVAVMTARERGGLLSIAVVVQRTTGAALGVAVLLAGFGVTAVCVTYAIGSAAGLALGVWLMARHIGRPAFHVDRAQWPGILRESLPFALYDSLGFVLTKVDTVILSILASSSAVGLYGAASRLYESSFFITFSLNGAFLAMYTYLTPTSEPTIGDVFERSIKLALVLLLPVAVVFACAAEPLSTLFFGDDFAATAEPLRWLAPAVVLMGVVNLSSSLVAMRVGARALIPFTAGVLVLNVVLNFALVPVMDAAGSALAMSLSLGAFSVVGLTLAAREVGHLPLLRMLASPLVAAAAMALVMLSIGSLVFAIAAGVVVFALVYLGAERLFAPDDLRFVLEAARRGLRTAAPSRSA